MNLRLSEEGVRYRVTREELARLLAGQSIKLVLSLPRDHVFRANVRPSALGQWQLETDPTGLWLTIPTAELQTLADSLPSRDGLEHEFGLLSGASVRVAFEVDVKDRRG